MRADEGEQQIVVTRTGCEPYDLTIIVLANLADAEPSKFVEGIAAILNPRLAVPALTPIQDREPQVKARLESLLAAAGEGELAADQFAYVRASFFPEVAKEYADLLHGLGQPRQLDLLERRELGDDRIYQYDVLYAEKTLRVRLGLAPDDKISLFDLEPK